MKRGTSLLVGIFLMSFTLVGCGSNTDSSNANTDSSNAAAQDALYDSTLQSLGGPTPAYWTELYTTVDTSHIFWFMDYEPSRAFAKGQLCTLITTGAPYDELIQSIQSNVVLNDPTAKAMVAAATKAYCPN
jgi:hypothetical protein